MQYRHTDEADSGRAIAADRRDERRTGNRLLGRVVACTGARAVISTVAEDGETAQSELWSVGRLVSIKVGDTRVVALVYAMNTSQKVWMEETDNVMHVEVELVGEIRTGDGGKPRFSAGISNYPFMGAIAHRIRSEDLRAIYDIGMSDTAVIGKLTQDDTMDAAIHIPSMLQRHFAVVGTTGVGKSSAVSLLLQTAIESDPELRIVILDPHNEFAAAFPESSVVVDTDTLDLPFWLFRLEELVEVIFRGRPGVSEEIDTLRDLIPEAKRGFRGSADNGLFRRASDKSSLTADTPVPYRIADLIALIDERIGRLEGRNEKPHLRSLKTRIMSAVNDPRFHFMFSSNTITDTLADTLGHLFRIPADGRPITTFQLAGIPSEVVNSVASVLCRMAFELSLWSGGAIRTLVVCEEAHRYVPADRSLGFVPTRQAIARIAKEGRKYGVSLGVVTQRPGELDPTILSQCSTVFAMRLANDHDQEIIRSAIPDSSTSTTSFLSSIDNGEAIAFGEAVAVPMRMRFTRLPQARLPHASSALNEHRHTVQDIDMRVIVQRMRAISGPEAAAYAGSGAIAGKDPYSQPLVAPQAGDPDGRAAQPPSHSPPMSSDDPDTVAYAQSRLRRHDDPPVRPAWQSPIPPRASNAESAESRMERRLANLAASREERVGRSGDESAPHATRAPNPRTSGSSDLRAAILRKPLDHLNK